MHRHRYEPVSAQQGEFAFYPGSNGTWVLFRCKKDGCLKTKVDTLNGHWTLDQLKGGEAR